VVPHLVERLEKRIRRHLSASMPAGQGYFEEQTLVNLMIDYRVWRSRFVQPLPRRVNLSKEFRKSSKRQMHAAALTVIEANIARGEDLNAHLSTRISRLVGGDPAKPPSQRTDRDLLLAEWGVHHLHLSTEMGKNGFMKRTGDVLFVVFRGPDAYLLGIFGHPQHENWAAEEIFAVMARNWPDAGLVHEANYVVGLSQEYSDEDRLELRKASMNSALQIDGKVFSPGGIGMALDGTPLLAVQAAQQVMWELSRWEKDTAKRLGEVDGVPRFAYWLPAIRVSVSGFEEYAGFVSGSTFVPVGRLC
jgi:hypothetical protein